jgi:hypothetical protein
MTSTTLTCAKLIEKNALNSELNYNLMDSYKKAKNDKYNQWDSVFKQIEQKVNPDPTLVAQATSLKQEYDNIKSPVLNNIYNDICCYVDNTQLFDTSKNVCIPGPTPAPTQTPTPTSTPTPTQNPTPNPTSPSGLPEINLPSLQEIQAKLDEVFNKPVEGTNNSITVGQLVGAILGPIILIIIITLAVVYGRKRNDY